MLVEAEVIKQVIGNTIASGPAGFGIHHNVEGAADLNAGFATARLDKESAARAHAQHDRNENKPFADAIKRDEQRSAENTLRYGNMFDRRGLDGALRGRGSAALRQNLRTEHMRAAGVSNGPAAPGVLHNRVMPTTRATFNKAGRYYLSRRNELKNVPEFKAISINPRQLPRAEQDKMIQAAMQKGQKYTPLGAVPQMRRGPGAQGRKRNWALFFNPEMIPSGWATD